MYEISTQQARGLGKAKVAAASCNLTLLPTSSLYAIYYNPSQILLDSLQTQQHVPTQVYLCNSRTNSLFLLTFIIAFPSLSLIAAFNGKKTTDFKSRKWMHYEL